jgi:sporulation protein YlmC with PRC-barrel domain
MRVRETVQTILRLSVIALLAMFPLVPSGAKVPEVFNMRSLLGMPIGVPLKGQEDARAQRHSQIDDLLVDSIGQITDVIVQPGAAVDGSREPRQVPWSQADLSKTNDRLISNVDADALGQFPVFHGAVTGTVGRPDAVLASKLLEASVRNPLGTSVGSVQDVMFNMSGRVQTVVIVTDRGPVHTPWAQLSVQPDRVSQNIPHGSPNAVVVWNR